MPFAYVDEMRLTLLPTLADLSHCSLAIHLMEMDMHAQPLKSTRHTRIVQVHCAGHRPVSDPRADSPSLTTTPPIESRSRGNHLIVRAPGSSSRFGPACSSPQMVQNATNMETSRHPPSSCRRRRLLTGRRIGARWRRRARCVAAARGPPSTRTHSRPPTP